MSTLRSQPFVRRTSYRLERDPSRVIVGDVMTTRQPS